MLNVSEYKLKIEKCRAALSMGLAANVFVAKIPIGDLEFNQAARLMFIFHRYGNRALYHASNFLTHYQVAIEKATSTVFESKEYSVVIDDDLYHDFDAFVISCKSIMEGNIIGLSKGLSEQAKAEFYKMAQIAKDNILDPLIIPIRDEVVHLNKYGSNVGSMAYVKKVDGRFFVEFKSNFDSTDGEKYEIVELFILILSAIIKIAFEVVGIFFSHSFDKYGPPKRDIIYSCGGVQISLSELNIPGYDIQNINRLST